MKAVCWHGAGDMRVDTIPDPEIINPRDAILKVTSTAICGSDLHLYDGYIPTMKKGDVVGHEFMGEVVELGSQVKNLKVGDRVVVPFPISCGNCYFCQKDQWSLCDNSNPNTAVAEKMWGHAPAGIFGYSHMAGGYAGGQAEYVRVPYADVGPMKVPSHLHDDKVLFLTDIFPTGYMAAEHCNIQPGDTVAVWGCGPVGQFSIASALMLGAERVIAMDDVPERLELAKQRKNVDVLDTRDFKNSLELVDALNTMTGGRGPDSCIESVGMEAHGMGVEHVYDKAKQTLRMETGRPNALRQAILACRKGGTISMPGVYGGFVDKIPMGAVMNKSLTLKTGQTHVHRYLKPLLDRVAAEEIDPSFVISHKLNLEDAPQAYRMFRDKTDNCTKVVMRPGNTEALPPI